MAFSQLITVFAIALAFSSIDFTLCSEVKGSVSCTDCGSGYDFAGIRVLVKCDQVKKLSEAITDKKGNFKTTLPSNSPTSQVATSPKCLAKLLGGPTQLYALKQDTVSEIVLAKGEKNTYTTRTPLVFSKSCHGKCGSHDPNIDSSMTVDLPSPSEWGLPPTSDFFSFFPIIGIP
uniref:Pollen Ole e 1 allergen and extensin family protein n=1 Tax=Silene latifolia TaxID=37657 RepID=T1DFA9_SILLA